MNRPRLSSDVRARRHLVGDEARVILHAPGPRALGVGDREWRVIEAMDGTRDLAGVAAKAAMPLAEVKAFVRSLGSLGLLEEGGPAPASGLGPTANAFARDLPIRSLVGYRFRCDGTGGCCRTFGTVAFTPLEAARARACRPEVLDAGQRPRAAFFPAEGLDETLLAVAMVDGGCAYLASDGRCGIHAAAGADHKPFGCRTFPARFVDVGHEIRVVPRPECACVFDDRGGEPLTHAERGRDLPRETYVPRLPERISMSGADVDAAEFVAWCDAQELPEGEDLASWCEDRARALAGQREGPRRDLEIRQHIRRLLAAAERLDRENADWRAETDLVRRATGWMVTALRSLAEGEPPPPSDPAAERLYLRAALFGCTLADAGDVAVGLHRCALHLRIARAFPPQARADRAGRHPLALVEALARGHGLAT